jgi:cell wall-associated NlpC family hydrolase
MQPKDPLRTAMVLAALTLVGACASGGGIPRPFPSPGNRPVFAPPAVLDPSAPAAVGRTDLIGTALALRGIPYLNGGTGPRGFDCSGFTQYVYARHGVQLPREVRDQFAEGTPVKDDDLKVGDLLFFTTVAPGPTHVGIAIGGDEFVHAPSSRGVVRVERFSAAYWSARYLGARRFD